MKPTAASTPRAGKRAATLTTLNSSSGCAGLRGPPVSAIARAIVACALTTVAAIGHSGSWLRAISGLSSRKWLSTAHVSGSRIHQPYQGADVRMPTPAAENASVRAFAMRGSMSSSRSRSNGVGHSHVPRASMAHVSAGAPALLNFAWTR